MDLQAQIVEAIRLELARQSGGAGAALNFSDDEGRAKVNGSLDLEALAMAISGAVAGGP
ncbi:MAG TPA: hypothetical protein VF686_00180 [Brevundimonas sp.]|jgi:hypothetical protein